MSITVLLAQLIVSLLIALISLRGYRDYLSTTMLWLSASFFLVATGVALQGLSEVSEGFTSSYLLFTGLLCEAAAYFLIAISHVYTVRTDFVLVSLLPIVIFQQTGFFELTDSVVRSVSFFLLAYIFTETMIFALQNKGKFAAISSFGFLFLAISIFLNLFLPTLSYQTVLVQTLKLAGFIILATPLTVFAARRDRVGA